MNVDLALNNSGIVIQCARKYWPRLPFNTRTVYDLDDMVSELTLHILLRSDRYDPKLGGMSTFVWRITERHAIEILRYYWTPKRTAVVVSIDDAEVVTESSSHTESSRLVESKNAVETVIEFGSDAVLNVIECLVLGKPCHLPNWNIQEMRRVCNKHFAHYEDFVRVLRTVV